MQEPAARTVSQTPDEPAFRIGAAASPGDLAAVADLFRAYAEAIGIDLSYQGFEAELAGLPGAYAPPRGALLLARLPGGRAAGCVALRPLDGGSACEMKRLYVDPAARGLGLGRALVAAVIGEARRCGYRQMRLDTLPGMASARALYAQAGFSPIPPYYDTPVAGTLFLGRRL